MTEPDPLIGQTKFILPGLLLEPTPVSFESTPYASVNQAKEQTRVALTVGLVSVVRPVECSESRLQRQ